MSDASPFFTDRALPVPDLVQADDPSAAKISFFFLCLFTVAIYARPEDIFPVVGQVHLTLVLGICAVATYLGAWLSGSAPLLSSRELRLMLLLTAWFMVGVPFAYWRGGSLEILTQIWLKTLAVFFLLTQTLLSLSRIRTVLWAIILSELAVTAYSVLNPSQDKWVGDRMAGVNQGILGWNFLGIAVALTIPYIGALFVENCTLLKSLLLAAATAAMMWMLVLTASRSGIMVVGFSLALTWLMVLRRSTRGKLIGIGLVVSMAVVICAAPGVFWERIQTIWSSSDPTNSVSASADASEAERRNVLMDSVRYTVENPIVGLGLGNFSVARGTETGVSSGWLGTHNSFTELSSEAGVPALLIFVCLLASSIRSMWRTARTEYTSPDGAQLNGMARATLVSLVAFAVGGFFAHIAYEYYLYYPIAVAVALEHLSFAMQPASIDQPLHAPNNSHDSFGVRTP